jgi:type IX secretion system PorP/SprF family membrane protein
MKKYINIKGLLGIFLVIIQLSPATAQQNIQFTQYIFNTLSVNPAYAGYKEQLFGQMALRSQWSGIEDAPRTGQISVDGIIDSETKRMGFGVQLGADKLGPQSSTSAYLNYAYRLQLDAEDTKRLSFGIGAGVTQYSINYSKLTPIDEDDQYATQGESGNFVPDFRFGVYYYSPKWYLGASIMDLLSNGTKGSLNSTELSQGVIAHKRHLYIISGMLLNINSEVKLRPSLLLKEDFKGPTSLDINSMVIFNDKFWIGASYRSGIKLWKKSFDEGQGISSSNSVSGVAQFYINEVFRVGYSYDYSLSSMRAIENGSHELTLGVSLSPKTLKLLSPRFF